MMLVLFGGLAFRGGGGGPDVQRQRRLTEVRIPIHF